MSEAFHRVIESESGQDWRLGESGCREVVVSVTEQAESRFQQVEKPRGHRVKERVRERVSESERKSWSRRTDRIKEGVRSPEIRQFKPSMLPFRIASRATV